VRVARSEENSIRHDNGGSSFPSRACMKG
jgi:hypothetical protein